MIKALCSTMLLFLCISYLSPGENDDMALIIEQAKKHALPLFCDSSKLGNAKYLSRILEQNRLVMKVCDNGRNTLLHHAVAGMHHLTIMELLINGANIHSENIYGENPIEWGLAQAAKHSLNQERFNDLVSFLCSIESPNVKDLVPISYQKTFSCASTSSSNKRARR